MKSQLLYIDSCDRHSVVEVEYAPLVVPWVLFAKLWDYVVNTEWRTPGLEVLRRMLLVPFWVCMILPRIVISVLYVVVQPLVLSNEVVLNSFYSGVRGSQSWD